MAEWRVKAQSEKKRERQEDRKIRKSSFGRTSTAAGFRLGLLVMGPDVRVGCRRRQIEGGPKSLLHTLRREPGLILAWVLCEPFLDFSQPVLDFGTGDFITNAPCEKHVCAAIERQSLWSLQPCRSTARLPPSHQSAIRSLP